MNKARGPITHPSDGGDLCLSCFTRVGKLLSKGDTVSKHTATEVKAMLDGSSAASSKVATGIASGQYLSGFSTANSPVENTFISFTESEAECIAKDKTPSEVGRLLLSSIKGVSIEDASTIEKRITATRLLATGIFALAMKKKEKHEVHYVTVSFTDGKFDSDLVFQFEGKDSQTSANTLRSAFVSHANKS